MKVTEKNATKAAHTFRNEAGGGLVQPADSKSQAHESFELHTFKHKDAVRM